MDRSEFDKFAEEYHNLHQANIKASGESPEFFSEYKIKDTAELARALNLNTNLKILDFGSGVGNSVPHFKSHFPDSQLTCLDVSSKSLELAEKRFPGQASFVPFDGERIPFNNDSFNIIFSACVFHHISHAEHEAILKELYRVLQPGGILVIFEHNPYNPLTRHAVNTCEFDENAVLITATQFLRRINSAGFTNSLRCYRIFFPGLIRIFRPVEKFLKWLPLGAQYYVMAQKH